MDGGAGGTTTLGSVGGNAIDEDDSASVLLMLPNAYSTGQRAQPSHSSGGGGGGGGSGGVGAGSGGADGGIKMFPKSRTHAEATLRREIEEREKERATGGPSAQPHSHYNFPPPSSSLPPHFRSRHPQMYQQPGSVPLPHPHNGSAFVSTGYPHTSMPMYTHPHLYPASPLSSLTSSPYASLGSRSVPFGSSQITSSVTPQPYPSNAAVGMASYNPNSAFRNRSEPLNPSDTMQRYSAFLSARAQSLPQGPRPNPYISKSGYNVTPRFYNPNINSSTMSSLSSFSSDEFDKEKERDGEREREREREKERERASELVIPPESFRALAGLCEKLITKTDGEGGREGEGEAMRLDGEREKVRGGERGEIGC